MPDPTGSGWTDGYCRISRGAGVAHDADGNMTAGGAHGYSAQVFDEFDEFDEFS